MHNIQLIPKPDRHEWNAVVAHPLQTFEWAQARREHGQDVRFIGVYSGEVLQEGYLVIIHKLHPRLPFRIGYVQRSLLPPKEVLEFLYTWGKKEGLLFIKLEPDANKQDKKSSNWLTDIAQLSFSLLSSPHPIFIPWTMELNLTLSEEELAALLKPKNRYNIGLAQRKGVVVKERTDEEGYKEFEALYFETTKRQGYSGHTPRYHRAIFKHLKESIAHILIAYYLQKPLCAYELFLFKDVLYYPYGGSSKEHKNVMASNLLMWEAIMFGKRNGAKRFDMWGALDPDTYVKNPNHPWAGFTRFKEQFGAVFVEKIGSYDIVLHPILYGLFTLAWKIRKGR